MSTAERPEVRDAIVIGGNLAGLNIAHMLSQLGYKALLLERAKFLGGVDSSFTNKFGRIFDFGLHNMDYMRSEYVTRLFERIVEGGVRKLERKRAIVLRNYQISYNSPMEEWPEELQTLTRGGSMVDDLGAQPPTRNNLSAIYGKGFVEMIFDEALPAYPAEANHLKFGAPEHLLLTNIYPWFFPNVPRREANTTASRKYQDKVRVQPTEYVLYPKEGGFGRFADSLAKEITRAGSEIVTDIPDLEFDIDLGGPYVKCVTARRRKYTSNRVFWCAPPGPLLQLLQREVPNITPDQFVLGSLHFRDSLKCDFNEVILADPTHRINRMSFPGYLTQTANDQVQMEFSFPRTDERFQFSPEQWCKGWLESLQRLGVLSEDNPLLDFDLKQVPLLYNAFGVEGQSAPELDFGRFKSDSNLKPVLPTLRKENINTRVPKYLKFVAEELSRNPTPV